MKPTLKFSEFLHAWVCFDGCIRAIGSSPRVAYAVWLQRKAEVQMHALLETL